MEQIVIQQRVLDRIMLEDRHSFNVYALVCASPNGYRIKYEFIDLSDDEFTAANKLCLLNKPLKIKSVLFSEKLINIQNIIVANFRTDLSHALYWECIAHNCI
jgi:hypothetical protein